MIALDALRILAEEHGVAASYQDVHQRSVRVPVDTLLAVVQALGVPVRGAGDAAHALDSSRRAAGQRLLEPVVLARPRPPTPGGQESAGSTRLHIPRGWRAEAQLHLEDGGIMPVPASGPTTGPVQAEDAQVDAVQVALPAALPVGYHRLIVSAGGGGRQREDSAVVIAAPPRCPFPAALRPSWGWMTQLYALRSADSWGLGDLADLRVLSAHSAARFGADLVVCNPLHAASPDLPQQASPYFPSSRRFANPLYVRVEDVPELSGLGGSRRERFEALAAQGRAANRTERIDRDLVYRLKREALALLHTVEPGPARRRSFEAYRTREGRGLRDFATFCALAEREGLPWQTWPTGLRHPRAAAVGRAREQLRAAAELHEWMQWLLDGQLGDAQGAAQAAGMTVGIVHDLAVGVDPGGADAWALQDDLATEVTIGAPPDPFNRLGQDWGMPPFLPRRLRATGYAALRAMLSGVLRHCGGVRIDHVLGLFRLFWVPSGCTPAGGTYVRYPAQELLAVLALEAERAGAIVVGEDLGTVAPGVRDSLADKRVLGSRVFYFERDPQGDPLPARAYPSGTMASVTTHDLPTAAGWWLDEDVRVQAELGLFTPDTTAEEQRQRKAAQRAELEALLHAEELVGDEPTVQELVDAMHAFLARCGSLLVVVNAGDAVGDLRQPNMPGTTTQYPNWCLPVSDASGRPLSLEEFLDSDGARRVAEILRGRAAVGVQTQRSR